MKFQAMPRSMEPENYEAHEFSYELRLKLLRSVMVLESVIAYPPKQSHKGVLRRLPSLHGVRQVG